MGVGKKQAQEHKRELDRIITEWMETLALPEPYYIHISDLTSEFHLTKRSRWFYDTSRNEFILEVEKNRLFEDLVTNHLKGWRSDAKKLNERWKIYRSLAEEYILSCRAFYYRIESEVDAGLEPVGGDENAPTITDNFTRFIYQNAFYRQMNIYGFEEMAYQIKGRGKNAELWLGNTVLAGGVMDDMATLKNIHRALMASFGMYADEVDAIVENKRALDDLKDELIPYMDELLKKKRLKGRCNYTG
jgi:hypothetical protein